MKETKSPKFDSHFSARLINRLSNERFTSCYSCGFIFTAQGHQKKRGARSTD